MSRLVAHGLGIRLGSRRLLAPLDLVLEPGQMLGIIGPNGAGKSTLLKALAGLQPASEGRVLCDDNDLATWARTERARALGYLAQDPELHWPLLVDDLVALGRVAHGARLGHLGAADRAAIALAVEQTGIAALLGRRADTLSGGERARAHLARLFAGRQPILLADEPIANLDPRYQSEILGLLAGHAAQGGSVAVVLHDLNLAARYCSQLLLLVDGELRVSATPEIVLSATHVAAGFGVPADYLYANGIDRALAARRARVE